MICHSLPTISLKVVTCNKQISINLGTQWTHQIKRLCNTICSFTCWSNLIQIQGAYRSQKAFRSSEAHREQSRCVKLGSLMRLPSAEYKHVIGEWVPLVPLVEPSCRAKWLGTLLCNLQRIQGFVSSPPAQSHSPLIRRKCEDSGPTQRSLCMKTRNIMWSQLPHVLNAQISVQRSMTSNFKKEIDIWSILLSVGNHDHIKTEFGHVQG